MIVTLGFIVVFTLLGVAVMHLAGAQNDVAVKQSFSTEAFWLADGVVERIRNKIMAQADLPAVNTPVVIDSEHFYQISQLSLSPGYSHRWDAVTQGTVHGQLRTIKAIISEFHVIDALVATGSINAGCAPDGSAEILGTCRQDPSITLLNVFGLTYNNDHVNPPTLSYGATNIPVDYSYTGSNYGNQVYSGVAVITSSSTVHNTSGNEITNTAADPVFLIIDCSCPPSNPTCNPPNDCYKSTANNPLHGIVWVIGNVDMQGTPEINGALFVQNGNLSGQLNGNNLIEYDESVINTVLSNIGGGILKEPAIVSWKEQ